MVITTAQLHSSMPELRFRLCHVGDSWCWGYVYGPSWKIRLNTFPQLIIPLKQFIIIKHLLLSVCYYHVMYAFQSEPTPYICLHVKDLFARSRHEIWSLSDCDWTRTHNHLVHKRTWTMWLWVQVQLQSITKFNNNCLWGYYRRSCYFFFNL